MPIDFFTAPCAKADGNCKIAGIVCKSAKKANKFGLCDDTPPPHVPAYINIDKPESWIAEVENTNPAQEITFKAIDNCVELIRINNDKAKRCEGVLVYGKKLIFLELKKRQTGRWLADAREKLEETILMFNNSYPNHDFNILEPYIANKLQYKVHQNQMVEEEKLKNAIGLKFRLSTTIKIE